MLPSIDITRVAIMECISVGESEKTEMDLVYIQVSIYIYTHALSVDFGKYFTQKKSTRLKCELHLKASNCDVCFNLKGTYTCKGRLRAYPAMPLFYQNHFLIIFKIMKNCNSN